MLKILPGIYLKIYGGDFKILYIYEENKNKAFLLEKLNNIQLSLLKKEFNSFLRVFNYNIQGIDYMCFYRPGKLEDVFDKADGKKVRLDFDIWKRGEKFSPFDFYVSYESLNKMEVLRHIYERDKNGFKKLVIGGNLPKLGLVQILQ